ncbi:hypothetical protein CN300_30935 [Bacillus thuringiensis]|uniref:ATP-binding protein n=1 Tax=Bacillus thuringiensis TaxID=1428 RepID=UPI000BF597C0|nr:ATP-binding protein [Bacillus thuringiensis]PFC36694.1 hypothetical protein CN300_30935 [Bacillus thuringiensis]
MILNINGYKMIFHLENLLRDFCNEYSNKELMDENTYNQLEASALKSSTDDNLTFREILNFTHLGELLDIIKSKKFKQNKSNNINSINPSFLIKHRNDIMHSRSISNDELEKIQSDCGNIIDALNEQNYQNHWHKFINDEIDEYRIPLLHMVYPIGKNFDKLVGRQEELKKLKYELGATIPRSITGQGGLGKTALVLQLVEDFLHDPTQPFENIYFMSFKNSAFENGKITRFEKSINNHEDLIYRLASFMGIDTATLTFEEIENIVWDNFFKQKSLLILDNLETEIVKSNLNEFTQIAEKFIMSFSSKSRLIITSRFGLGDREAKTPLHRFNLEDTKTLIKNYLSEENYKKKNINEFDWEWIQKYTGGNPGLIIALSNFLISTEKKISDIRIEFDSQYTEESKVLHNQHDEFINFCFENTVESMNENSQKFLAVLCYICSESNLSKISEEFLTYLKEEVGLKNLGEGNLRSQIFSNIGFLQPLPSSDKFLVNELLMIYLDRSNSENIFNVYQVKDLEWKPEIDELINFINEIQFEDEVTIDNLLSELYTSKFIRTGENMYLIKSYFCLPTLSKLIKVYKSLDHKELIKKFNLMEKIKSELSNPYFKKDQEKIVSMCINALQVTYNDIVQKRVNKLFQSDLVKYFNQLETYIPIVKRKEIPLYDKKVLCKLLNNVQQYELVRQWTNGVPELINERFFMLIKSLNKSLISHKGPRPPQIIKECDEILKRYPSDITFKHQGQYKLYKAKAIYKKDSQEALVLLDNYSMYYVSDNATTTILYLDALLITMECYINLSVDIEKIENTEERFLKIFNRSKSEGKIFERNRDKMEEKYKMLKIRITQYN